MPRIVRWIWTLLGFHLALGTIAFLHFVLTGEYALLTWYFWALGSLFFLIMTATECGFALVCCSWFDADEPMRLAWLMIACAALARFTGTLLRGISNPHLTWVSGHWLGWASAGLLAGLSQLGLVVGGPLSMAFLAIGLARVLRIQRRFHLIGALTRGDQALLVLIVAFTFSQIGTILPLLGSHPSAATMLLWLSDPLLSLLLIEAVLVRRSVIRMGQGLVARCWGMFVLAIATTSAGDAAIWAANHNLLPEPLNALSWFIWFVAAAAFACAPAYQLAAMSLVKEETVQSPGAN
jgi:hypothetical protein